MLDDTELVNLLDTTAMYFRLLLEGKVENCSMGHGSLIHAGYMALQVSDVTKPQDCVDWAERLKQACFEIASEELYYTAEALVPIDLGRLFHRSDDEVDSIVHQWRFQLAVALEPIAIRHFRLNRRKLRRYISKRYAR